MRELTGHKVNGCNEAINVIVMDQPGQGGACHHYRIEPITDRHPQGAINPVDIRFQNGPVKEAGVNGLTHEALLAVLIDRLEGFQSGPYAHPYNSDALTSLLSAQASLQQRTRDRIWRGVDGTHTI